MTKDEILALAREVGLWEMFEGYSSEYGSLDAKEDCLPDLERFVARIIAAERDRICTMLDGLQKQTENHNYYGFIRNLIREMK